MSKIDAQKLVEIEFMGTTALQGPDGVPVLVTNTSRGVYFGYTDLDCIVEPTMPFILRRMRQLYYWKCFPDYKGVFGQAARGPAEGSRIGPEIDAIVRNVSSVSFATAIAVNQFDSMGWSS